MEEKKLKSALELALERMEQASSKEEGGIALSQEQKERISQLKKEYDAKIAEKEIMLQAQLKELILNYKRGETEEKIDHLRRKYVDEKERLEKEKEDKIEEARQGIKT